MYSDSVSVVHVHIVSFPVLIGLLQQTRAQQLYV